MIDKASSTPRQSRYARVAVHVPRVQGVFDYLIPAELQGRLSIGSLVEVPFGSQQVQALILDFPTQSAVKDLKELSEPVDPNPVVTRWQLRLAEWLHANSVGSISQCAMLMVFPGLRKFADTRYTRIDFDKPVSGLAARLAEEISERKGLRGGQIERAYAYHNWQSALRSLVKQGIVSAETYLTRPGLHAKTIKRVQLTIPTEQIDFDSPPLTSRSPQRALARSALMRFLIEHPEPMDVQWARAHVDAELIPDDFAALCEAEYIQVWETETIRDPLQKLAEEVYRPHTLSPAQQAAWEQILPRLNPTPDSNTIQPIMLHGITGSGKTELYLKAAEQIVARGKQVIWLVPEISLTPQTVGRLMHRFPGQVGLVHSRMSEGERYDTWQRARAGKIKIIAGPRSALFTPLPDPGLIVVDEFHDSSYYSNDEIPAYTAVELAMASARICGAACILGSATPDVALYHRFKTEGWPVLELAARAAFTPTEGGGLPPIEVVDMRAELRRGNRSIFSEALAHELEETLRAGKQSILFLNRRGSATHVFCRECGTVLKCPRCDLPLTAHHLENQLLCHTCGYSRRPPKQCPNCQSPAIRQVGIGTETVEKTLRSLLPRARLLRWDADSRRDQKLSDLVLTHFRNHQYDILIGTQMVSKGLDFPLVQTVGMVLADIGLNLPDYRAPERIFQVLTQVAGRAGRTGADGHVILQTYEPDHYAIQSASQHDFFSFYEQELKYRKMPGYPPFARIIRIEYRDADEVNARVRLEDLAAELRGWLEQAGLYHTEVLGPLPCFFARQNDIYRWQVILRGADPLPVLRQRVERLADFRVEVNPLNLL